MGDRGMSRASDLLVVVTTVGDMETARAMARSLVERRLCACIQLSGIESCYHWNGAVQHDAEVRLVCKTTRAQWPRVHEAIVALHPYELPAVHAHAVEQVHPAYGAWVVEQCQAPDTPS